LESYRLAAAKIREGKGFARPQRGYQAGEH
jgi:hypothetical protein